MASLLQISSLFLFVCLSSSHIGSSRKLDFGSKEVKNDTFLPSNDSTFSFGFDPSKSIQLSWHPRVFLYEGFISDEECDHLLSLANSKQPLVTDNSTKDGSNTAVVSSHNGLELARGQDEIVLRIEERISAWTFLPSENGEGIQIFHYGVDEGSEPLYQYNNNQDNFENVKSGPRIATILIFLSNVSRGGEITFPKSKVKGLHTKSRKERWSECASLGFAVEHVKKNALVIFNLHPNATVDERSLHSGCSVLEGEKWSATKWMRSSAFDQTKRSTDSEEECSDEDDNCRQWAAVGECQKNSVYMLGTPDYYGSCRKSCGVC